ncbi:MAG: alanyl-tRNA editing protein [Oscillospiraceae bacterium]|nr:alanyl-tRNA editing protein [Oscillospiraceae bacterium]
MDTIKLYYDDVTLREFDATVLSCAAAKNGWAVVLDRTTFYPEGGGQPCDRGTLGAVSVTDVHEKDGVITHTCDGPLPVGETVHGAIDWARRFDHMQQHSGEHIVSGLLCAAYGCDNVGFHLGEDTVIIDYNADIPWEGVLEIEKKANQYIWEDHPFEVLWPTAEELAALPYRSKKALTGAVRITSFPGADMCACCGTHVVRSGQVGLVKFLSCQKFREGVRLELLCGKRAMDYLAMNWDQNRAVGQALSVKPQATAAAVAKLQTELSALRQRVTALEEASFAARAEACRGRGDVLLVTEALQGDGVQRLCDAVSQVCGGRAAVFAGAEVAYRYALIHPGHDLSPLVKALNAALHGRGGGRDGFAQGSVAATEAEIRDFFQTV